PRAVGPGRRSRAVSASRARLVQSLAMHFGATIVPAIAANEVELELRALDLAAAVAAIRADRGRLLALYGSDERALPEGAFRVRAVLETESDDLLVVLRASLDADRPELPSITRSAAP